MENKAPPYPDYSRPAPDAYGSTSFGSYPNQQGYPSQPAYPQPPQQPGYPPYVQPGFFFILI